MKMALADDIFERMARSLKTDGPLKDRRLLPRAASHASIIMTPIEGGAPGLAARVPVRDFSVDGIGLLYHRAMPRDAEFVVELPRKDDSPVAMLCRVRYCRMLGEGQFSLGGRFERVVDEEGYMGSLRTVSS